MTAVVKTVIWCVRRTGSTTSNQYYMNFLVIKQSALCKIVLFIFLNVLNQLTAFIHSIVCTVLNISAKPEKSCSLTHKSSEKSLNICEVCFLLVSVVFYETNFGKVTCDTKNSMLTITVLFPV